MPRSQVGTIEKYYILKVIIDERYSTLGVLLYRHCTQRYQSLLTRLLAEHCYDHSMQHCGNSFSLLEIWLGPRMTREKKLELSPDGRIHADRGCSHLWSQRVHRKASGEVVAEAGCQGVRYASSTLVSQKLMAPHHFALGIRRRYKFRS